jgi:hypothetical protein
MPFAGEQAAGRIEADPARARHEHFGPGVKIGEVGDRPARSVETLDVRLELDQVARHETGGESQVTQQLDEQPGRIATRSRPERQRLFRRLDSRLQTDQVLDLLLQSQIDRDEKVDRRPRRPIDRPQVLREASPFVGPFEKRTQLPFEPRFVGEGPVASRLFDEEVERIDHRHVGDQVDRDDELAGRLGKDESREEVPLRVLLPVDEMLLRNDSQRVARDRRPAMRRRPQANHLRSEHHRSVVAVARDMLERDANRHRRSPCGKGRAEARSRATRAIRTRDAPRPDASRRRCRGPHRRLRSAFAAGRRRTDAAPSARSSGHRCRRVPP